MRTAPALARLFLAGLMCAAGTAERKPEYLTDTGTILFKNKPFFPIGLYHVAPEQYELIAQSGFNAVQGESSRDLKEFKASLDVAQKHGLAVDVPLYADALVKKNLANSLEKLRLFGNHPAVLCWKIIDEPDIPEREAVRGEVPEVYEALKGADAKHPIELTMAFEKGLKHWSDFCDIIQIDRYPVPGRPLTEVSSFTRAAAAAKAPWQNLTYVVQCGWTPDLKTQPTVEQARAMVYLALINGAKGIFWYSMSEAQPAWDLTKSPLWPRMKELNAEIKALSEPLLIGADVPGIQCSAKEVQFLAKRHKSDLRLLVCNPGEQRVSATFTLPESLGIRSLTFLKTKEGVARTGAQFTVNLGPVDARTIVGNLKD